MRLSFLAFAVSAAASTVWVSNAAGWNAAISAAAAQMATGDPASRNYWNTVYYVLLQHVNSIPVTVADSPAGTASAPPLSQTNAIFTVGPSNTGNSVSVQQSALVLSGSDAIASAPDITMTNMVSMASMSSMGSMSMSAPSPSPTDTSPLSSVVSTSASTSTTSTSSTIKSKNAAVTAFPGLSGVAGAAILGFAAFV